MNFWNRLTDIVFRRDLYIQSLQSIIKMQVGQIEELRKDKDRITQQYERLLNRPEPEVAIKLDTTPADDKEHWLPLREKAELPSQKRERLRRESIKKKKELMQKQLEVE